MTKTFLLGVGAQKAGTTWVHQFLGKHPDCAMGPIKELHAFPTALQPDTPTAFTIGKFERLRDSITSYLEAPDPEKQGEALGRLRLHLDHASVGMGLGHYVSYFDRITRWNPKARLTGDITPVYSSLDAAGFSKVRTALAQQGYRIRVVFLMRDPVARCFSAIRMGVRNTGGKSDQLEQARRNFATRATAEWCAVRTRYEHTIAALEDVFEPQDIFYGFYETLFTQDEVDRLCDFLDIRRRPADFEHRANPSPHADDPTDEDLQRVAEFYAETYRFCANRFGAERIGSIWRHARRLDGKV